MHNQNTVINFFDVGNILETDPIIIPFNKFDFSVWTTWSGDYTRKVAICFEKLPFHRKSDGNTENASPDVSQDEKESMAMEMANVISGTLAKKYMNSNHALTGEIINLGPTIALQKDEKNESLIMKVIENTMVKLCLGETLPGLMVVSYRFKNAHSDLRILALVFDKPEVRA